MDTLPEWLKILGLVVTIAVVILVIVGTLLEVDARKTITDRYEWLNVLHFHTWKTLSEIRSSMAQVKGDPYLSFPTMEEDLRTLELECMVESEDIKKKMLGSIYYTKHYKLSKKGGQKRMDNHQNQSRNASGLAQPA